MGLESWPLAGSGIINPWEGVAIWTAAGEIAVEDNMRRVISGTLNGVVEPGLYAGGIHWVKPALADLDDDGDLDLFVGEDDGTMDFLRNVGSSSNPNWMLAATDYQGFDVGNHAKPTFGDLDNDGDYDLLVGAQDGRLHFYENTGTPTSPSWADPDPYYGEFDVGWYSAPLLADLDPSTGSGQALDLLVGNEEGRVWALENDGGDWSLLARQYGAARPDDAIGSRVMPPFQGAAGGPGHGAWARGIVPDGHSKVICVGDCARRYAKQRGVVLAKRGWSCVDQPLFLIGAQLSSRRWINDCWDKHMECSEGH